MTPTRCAVTRPDRITLCPTGFFAFIGARKAMLLVATAPDSELASGLLDAACEVYVSHVKECAEDKP